MSLTTGRGPLSGSPAGRFSTPVPHGVVYVEPFQRRVRAMVDGAAVVDSERVLLVHRPGEPPVYAFPADEALGMTSIPVPEAPGYVTVGWDAADAWYEEDEEIRGHPRNPYHRIDCLSTHRHLVVALGERILVDTTDTIALYETGLEPRLYVHPQHVTTARMVTSERITFCPYKGQATYWSAEVDDALVADVAWSYEDPSPESSAIKGMLSFDESRLNVATDLPEPVQPAP